MKFSDFPLDSKILEALERMEYSEVRPIQEVTIPLVLAGEDIIALAETGSGKTAACAIPICHKVDPQNKAIQALILVPTRELALQYAIETQKIGSLKGVQAFALFGGSDYGIQQAKMKAGVQVMIATPGRLIDLIYSRTIQLTQVETLILDEADEMLGMGFYEDLEFIFQCLVHPHQTLLFSATMPAEIRTIAKKHLRSPKEISLIQSQASPKQLIHQFFFSQHKRGNDLFELLKKIAPTQALIFCNARHEVEDLCKLLKPILHGVDFLHGGLSQELRSTITDKFRRQKIRYLIATDVAARGLDFSGVSHVINMHLPRSIESYLHRSGRTGRSGREGTCISLVAHKDLKTVEAIGKKVGKETEWLNTPPSPSSADTKAPQRPRFKGRPSGRKPM